METFPFHFLKGRRNDGKQVELSRAAPTVPTRKHRGVQDGRGRQINWPKQSARKGGHRAQGTGRRPQTQEQQPGLRPAETEVSRLKSALKVYHQPSPRPPGPRGCDCPQAGLSKMKPESEAEGKVQQEWPTWSPGAPSMPSSPICFTLDTETHLLPCQREH